MILEISTSCSSVIMYSFISVLKAIFNIIIVVAPILLIVSLTRIFIRGTFNPDDKKLVKKLINSIVSLSIIFFIPIIVNVVVHILDDTYIITDCWNNANDKFATTDSYYSFYDDADKKPIITSKDKYAHDYGDVNDNNSSYVNNSNSSSLKDVMNCAKKHADNKTYYTTINNKCYKENGKSSCGAGWCVRFVWYCFYTTGHKDLYYNGKYTGNPGKLASWGKSSGLIVNNKKGQEGDIFDLYSTNKGRYSHGGFIEKRYSDGSYGTIERCGDRVCRKKRNSLSLVIRPNYN